MKRHLKILIAVLVALLLTEGVVVGASVYETRRRTDAEIRLEFALAEIAMLKAKLMRCDEDADVEPATATALTTR
jgi:hypothetical protein